MPKYRPQTVAAAPPPADPAVLKAEVLALQTKLQKFIGDHPENAQKAAQIIHEWLAASPSSAK